MNIDSGDAGILFVYLFNLIGLFQWCVRQSCEVENIVREIYAVFLFICIK